jgi:hypothetical protein
MEISKQVARFLDEQGFGTFDETGVAGDIFIQTIPANPDRALAVFTSGGPGSDPGNEYGRTSVQILIRTVPGDPRGGEKTAMDIINAFNGLNSTYLTAGGNYVIDCQAVQSGAANIGQDSNGRYEYSQNFIIEYLKGEN